MNLALDTVLTRVFTAEHWRKLFVRSLAYPQHMREWLYNLYICSTAWRIKRGERLEIDGHQCKALLCFRVDSLEVHHKTYARIGDEDVQNDLVTLCERCHRREHSR